MTTRAASNVIVIATLAIDEAINFKFFFILLNSKAMLIFPCTYPLLVPMGSMHLRGCTHDHASNFVDIVGTS